MPFRLLTLLVLVCVMAFTLKILDIIQQTDHVGQLAVIGDLQANEGGESGKKSTTASKAKKEPEKKDAERKEPEKAESDKKSSDKKDAEHDGEKSKDGEHKSDDKSADESEHGEVKSDEKSDKKSEGEHEKKSSDKKEKKHGEEGGESEIVTEKPQESEALRFTPSEMNILERLSDRRKKLEEWEQELKLKENVLVITESRIDTKLQELRDIKKEVEDKLNKYSAQEKEKVESLVKIYENMKPKDAAPIFNQLDNDVLLQVASHMKEKKLALVMAQMPPERAREITVDLSEFAKMQKKVASGTAGATSLLTPAAPIGLPSDNPPAASDAAPVPQGN